MPREYSDAVSALGLGEARRLRPEVLVPLKIRLVEEPESLVVTLRIDEGVVYGVSRVGFDRDSAHAAVAVWSDCGPHCGGGGLTLLSKNEVGRWRVTKRIMVIQR